jgi:hypothetical protein
MTRLSLLKAGFAVCLFYSVSAMSFEGPLRDPTQLNMPLDQTAQRVKTARVVKADYDLIRKDFPQYARNSNAEIKAMLEKSAALISTTQLRPNDVNSPIAVAEETVKAYRPRGYGRALVFPFGDGLMDGKGAGALSPNLIKDDANGLASTVEAYREYVMEKTVSRILAQSNYKPGTVQSYAVIDYGFDIINADGTREPAGLVLRQAAVRGTAQGTTPPKESAEIEKILRKHGIVSDNTAFNYSYQTLDRNNIQSTKAGNIFDFGDYQFIPEKLELKSSPVQPDPAVRVPANFWSLEDAPATAEGIRTQEEAIIKNMLDQWRRGKLSEADVDAFTSKRLSHNNSRLSGPSCSLIPALEALAK